MIDHPSLIHAAKNTGDVVSVAVIGSALAGWLPPIASALTLIWTGIRIYETKTVQSFIRRRRRG